MKIAVVQSSEIKKHPWGHCFTARAHIPLDTEDLREAMRQGASRALLGHSAERNRFQNNRRQEIVRAFEVGYRKGVAAKKKALALLEQEISTLSEQELKCQLKRRTDE